MSGGFAYIFDEKGDCRDRINLGMVELEALNPEDAALVQALLREHHERTGSPKAQDLLSGWDRVSSKFVKVVPTEYRRVLEELSRRERASSSSQPVLHESP